MGSPLASATGLAFALGASPFIALDSLGRDERRAVGSVAVCPVRSLHLELSGQEPSEEFTAQKIVNLGFCLGDSLRAATRRIEGLVCKTQCEKILEASSTVLMGTRESGKVVEMDFAIADQARSKLGWSSRVGVVIVFVVVSPAQVVLGFKLVAALVVNG